MATKVRIIKSEMDKTLIEFEWKVIPFVKPFCYTSDTYIADNSHPLFKQVEVVMIIDVHFDRLRCTIHLDRWDDSRSPLHVCDFSVDLNGPEGYSYRGKLNSTRTEFLPYRGGHTSMCTYLCSELKPMDWLTLSVKVVLCGITRSHMLDSSPFKCKINSESESVQSTNQHMLDMQMKDKFTNFTLKSKDGSKLKVHKVMLCSSSEVFIEMLRCNMIENTEKEVTLELEDNKALKAFVTILYLSDVNFEVEFDTVLQCYLLFHMYLMQRQMFACSRYLIKNLNNDNCLQTYIWTIHTDSNVSKKAQMYCAKNLSVIRKTDFWQMFIIRPDCGQILDCILDVLVSA